MNTTQVSRPKSLPFDDPLHLGVHRFLVEEAQALDDRDFESWLAMLASDVRYQVPVTTTLTSGAQSRKAGEMDHFKEDLYSLKMRVHRFGTDFAWAEDPPSRTRRFLSNVCAYRTEADDEVRARSSFLLFRSRGDLREPDLLSGVRNDVLRRTTDGFLLLDRTVTLDESVLRTQNLAIFL